MHQWEYCVVYGGWLQETWVYFLREDQPEGYSEEHHGDHGARRCRGL